MCTCVYVLNYVQISGTVTIITVMSILVIILNCLSRIKLFLLYFFSALGFLVSLLLVCCCCCCSYCCYFCCHYYHTIAQIAFYDICIVTSISDFIYMDMISHIGTFLKSGVKRKEKNMKYFAEKD